MEQAIINGIINGVDVDQMRESIKAINSNPELAKFQFRANNRWLTGGYNRSTIKGFYGAGQEDTTRRDPFVLEADASPVLPNKDRAANPVEYVLHALAACLTTSLVYHAAARGVKVDEVESKLEGDLDLRGFLGLSEDVRTGYHSIRVTFRVKSDASAETLRELCRYSSVFDVVSNPVPVLVSLEKK